MSSSAHLFKMPAISPLLFGLIQCSIRPSYQIGNVFCPPCILRADELGQAYTQTGERQFLLIETLDDALRGYNVLLSGNLCQDYAEFVTTIAERPVDVFPDAMLDDIADGFQELVSSEVSVFVIHILEIVDVYDRQEEVMILAMCPPDLFEDLSIKMTPVVEAC